MGRPRKRRREDEGIEAMDLTSLDEHANFDLESSEYTLPDIHGTNQVIQPETIYSAQISMPNDELNFDQDYPPVDPTLENSESNFAIATPSTDDQGAAVAVIYPTPPSSHDPIPLAPCACLSEMYLTLSTLQTRTDFGFPAVLPTLRSALATTTNVLKCEQCPKQPMTAMQNVMLLTTLLTTITDSYRKLILAIDVEAKRAKESGELKGFRVGDNSMERMHLHTGTPDCPMGFDIELDGEEWRKFARSVVKADVDGSRSGSRSIMGLANQLDERQRQWHSDPTKEEARKAMTGENCVPREGEWSCLKMVDMIRRHIEVLGL
jgi:hypothetical protein